MAELPPYHELVARKVQAHPELLAVARQNVRRWLEDGNAPARRMRQWDQLLAAAEADPASLHGLLALLRSAAPDDVRLLEFSPFAGVLTREERRAAVEQCGFRH